MLTKIIVLIYIFKLPYIGEHSTYVSNKIKSLCKQYCKTTEVKLSFSMAKVGDVFSLKSRIPSYLKSCIVYYFVCAGCSASYVGETARYLDTRIHEHFNKATSPSNIFRHLRNNQTCKRACTESCFKVIDSARSEYTLKVKEAMHIKWLNPT